MAFGGTLVMNDCTFENNRIAYHNALDSGHNVRSMFLESSTARGLGWKQNCDPSCHLVAPFLPQCSSICLAFVVVHLFGKCIRSVV